MTRYTLRRFGVSATEAEAIAQGLRRRGSGEPHIDRRPRSGGGRSIIARLVRRSRRAASHDEIETVIDDAAPEDHGIAHPHRDALSTKTDVSGDPVARP
jgi:hypothetical protein